ncbi:uncharacterized protein LOC119560950 [Drosophila subpulchrella]|uniref:uncharacterized protein LOC119560950 n=1 Tax=Drosophila subpulchrella TaxID=1486046 RepID=UPI0018A1823E|nr:uncharacterized protein LOC119560950 [Drosophila subpulchrella]
MKTFLVILLISALALVQASTIRDEDYSVWPAGTSMETHPHSSNWPCDVGHFPQAYALMHKVDMRLNQIDNEDLKNRIQNFAVDALRRCTTNGQMDEHCVKISIGYTMAYIHHQKRVANRL